ncbi:MAG: sulfite exporter TauE/SafE family protein [Enhydrobacter sp.]|nr:sulfite exporter TauE/SafE family protein [Enhydrobacter sp.]
MPYSVLGLLVGFLVGMTGVGGGALMTPALVLIFGIHPATAVGTDLLFAGVTKAVGTGVHGFHGSVNWRIVALLASGSIPAAGGTLLALHWIGPQDASVARVITTVMGVALLATAGSFYLRSLLNAPRLADSEKGRFRQTVLTIGGGAAIGLLVTISSVGAGSLGIVALYFLYPLLATRVLVGSDVAHAVPLTLVAGAGYWLVGAVNWGMLAWLLAGSIPGVLVGSTLAPRVSEKVLRPILATILVLVGVKLLAT